MFGVLLRGRQKILKVRLKIESMPAFPGSSLGFLVPASCQIIFVSCDNVSKDFNMLILIYVRIFVENPVSFLAGAGPLDFFI